MYEETIKQALKATWRSARMAQIKSVEIDKNWEYFNGIKNCAEGLYFDLFNEEIHKKED